jgi:putative ABC transport system substrate-binding protein
MRRRDFTIGLLLAASSRAARAQERAKQRRIAIVIGAGPAARIDDPKNRFYQSIFGELRRLGDVEGQNLVVDAIPARGGPRAMPISLARSSIGTRM